MKSPSRTEMEECCVAKFGFAVRLEEVAMPFRMLAF